MKVCHAKVINKYLNFLLDLFLYYLNIGTFWFRLLQTSHFQNRVLFSCLSWVLWSRIVLSSQVSCTLQLRFVTYLHLSSPSTCQLSCLILIITIIIKSNNLPEGKLVYERNLCLRNISSNDTLVIKKKEIPNIYNLRRITRHNR